MRWLLRITSFFLIILCIVFNFQLAVGEERTSPFGANTAYTLNIATKEFSKEDILESLNSISQEYNLLLVRPLLNVQTKSYDLAYFGSSLPNINSLDEIKGEVYWLTDASPGKILPTGTLGDAPLDGTYYLISDSSPAVDSALQTWGENEGVEVRSEQIEHKSFIPLMALFTTAIGNSLLALGVLFLSLIVAWVISISKAQSMHLLVGQSPWEIQYFYLRKAGRWCLESAFLAGIAALLYLFFAGNSRQIIIFFPSLLKSIVLGVVACLLILLIVLFIARPGLVYLAERSFPHQKLKWIGSSVRLLVLVLIMVIAPGTLSMATSAYNYQQRQQVWENYQDIYNISLKNIFDADVNQAQENIESFLSLVEKNKEFYLSYSLREAFELESEKLGDYEDIVLVNRQWLERQDVSYSAPLGDFSLQKIQAEDFPDAVQGFLFGEGGKTGQLALFLREQRGLEESLKYYTYEGKTLMFPGMDSSYGGDVFMYRKVILIVVEEPFSDLSIDGFILAAMSTGNIFFAGKAGLGEYARQTGFDYFVFSIESFSQLGLEVLEEYRKYFQYHLISLLVLAFAILFTSYQSAAIWSNVYKRRIFTLRTSGRSYYEIIKQVIAKEVILALFIILILAFGRVVVNPGLFMEVGIVVVISFSVISLSLYLNFLAQAKSGFFQVSQRG